MSTAGLVQVRQPLGLDFYRRALASVVTLWRGHQWQQCDEGVYECLKLLQALREVNWLQSDEDKYPQDCDKSTHYY